MRTRWPRSRRSARSSRRAAPGSPPSAWRRRTGLSSARRSSPRGELPARLGDAAAGARVERTAPPDRRTGGSRGSPDTRGAARRGGEREDPRAVEPGGLVVEAFRVYRVFSCRRGSPRRPPRCPRPGRGRGRSRRSQAGPPCPGRPGCSPGRTQAARGRKTLSSAETYCDVFLQLGSAFSKILLVENGAVPAFQAGGAGSNPVGDTGLFSGQRPNRHRPPSRRLPLDT